MSAPEKPWPPLIIAEHVPPLVRWRDILLTAVAWIAFIALVDHEFALSLATLKALGMGGADAKVNWLYYLERLTPFFLIAGVLAATLVVFSVRTLRRRSRALLLPQPPPLEAADEARRAGLDAATLIAARSERIVIVGFEREDRLRVEAQPYD
jgi:poly-beta-1,6-N-acetyl-D-glucosamine biosynthesis protein PgaD